MADVQPKAAAAPAPKPAIPKPGKPGMPQQASGAPKKDYGKDFRGIIRLSGKELKGEFTLERGLDNIRGIGHNSAKNIAAVIKKVLGIDSKKLVGNLTDDEINKIEDLLKGINKHLGRKHLMNRPVDTETGEAKHLIGNDLMFAVRQDIQFEKDTKTWRGWRHTMGQRVRGQHSRTTGRTGSSVGVLKKALKQQKAAGAAKAQDASKDKK